MTSYTTRRKFQYTRLYTGTLWFRLMSQKAVALHYRPTETKVKLFGMENIVHFKGFCSYRYSFLVLLTSFQRPNSNPQVVTTNLPILLWSVRNTHKAIFSADDPLSGLTTGYIYTRIGRESIAPHVLLVTVTRIGSGAVAAYSLRRMKRYFDRTVKSTGAFQLKKKMNIRISYEGSANDTARFHVLPNGVRSTTP